MKSIFAIATAAAVGVLVSACAKPLEVASITDVRSKTGSKGIDVLEPKRVSGSQVPEFAGDQLLEVRTYVQTQNNGQTEVAGATCVVSAADFEATTQSPAKVRVPLYRQQSSQLAVSCEMPGYKKKMITVAAVDETRSNRLASGANSGLIGVIAVAAVDAMSDNSRNDWKYPLAGVVLEADGTPAR